MRMIDVDTKDLNPETINGIDFDTAIKEVEAFLNSDECKYPLHIYLCDVRDFAEWYRDELKEAPTIDAVSVVRCKECEDYNTTGCSKGFGWCKSMGRGVYDDFYCANGAKMENEGGT